jgi:hypothetical protein
MPMSEARRMLEPRKANKGKHPAKRCDIVVPVRCDEFDIADFRFEVCNLYSSFT